MSGVLSSADDDFCRFSSSLITRRIRRRDRVRHSGEDAATPKPADLTYARRGRRPSRGCRPGGRRRSHESGRTGQTWLCSFGLCGVGGWGLLAADDDRQLADTIRTQPVDRRRSRMRVIRPELATVHAPPARHVPPAGPLAAHRPAPASRCQPHASPARTTNARHGRPVLVGRPQRHGDRATRSRQRAATGRAARGEPAGVVGS